jgi:hypothetical protein
MIDILLQITGPDFCAGVVARDGRVIETAPRLRHHIPKGSTGAFVNAVCRERGWTWEKIHEVRSDGTNSTVSTKTIGPSGAT